MSTMSNRFYELCRRNFYAFARKVFNTLHPDQTQGFIPAPHVKAICYHLERAYAGEFRRLLISVPPRHLKSILAAVALPAWILGHHPHRRILVATYGADLASRHAHDFRRVIESDWYGCVFPRMSIDDRRNRALEVATRAGGFRKAVSPQGPSTGFGSDVLIIDDLMKATDARSEVERERVREFYRNLITRFDDKGAGVVVSIQQRLHEDDLPAYLLEQGGFQHLELKAIAEVDEAVPTYFGERFRRRKGEALFPNREPVEVLEALRRDIGAATFAAQYQQSPAAPEGNVVRWEWFHVSDQNIPREEFVWIVQSWDPAITAEPTSSYSACTTWGYKGGTWYLADIWRSRLEYPALRRMIADHARRWNASKVILERVGPGLTLWQDLRREFQIDAFGLRPKGDKVDRMIAQTGKIESGLIQIPREAPWLDEFRAEISAFPAGRYDDQVDSLSQFLRYLDTPAGRALVNKDPVTGRRSFRRRTI